MQTTRKNFLINQSTFLSHRNFTVIKILNTLLLFKKALEHMFITLGWVLDDKLLCFKIFST